MVTTPVGSGGSSSSGSSSGSGAKWLAKFLYDNGLRGREVGVRLVFGYARIRWTPHHRQRQVEPNGSIDYGLFQINKRPTPTSCGDAAGLLKICVT